MLTNNCSIKCASKERTCSYQPSRRGGPRRGHRYEEAQRHRSNDDPPSQRSPSGIMDSFGEFNVHQYILPD